MFCVSTVADKLIKDWTSYAVQTGNVNDADASFFNVARTIGYKQFIDQGLDNGLDMMQISDCWDLVKLNLNARR